MECTPSGACPRGIFLQFFHKLLTLTFLEIHCFSEFFHTHTHTYTYTHYAHARRSLTFSEFVIWFHLIYTITPTHYARTRITHTRTRTRNDFFLLGIHIDYSPKCTLFFSIQKNLYFFKFLVLKPHLSISLIKKFLRFFHFMQTNPNSQAKFNFSLIFARRLLH